MKSFIVIAALSLCVAACGSKQVNLNQSQMKTAENAGMKFAGNMNSDFVGCSGIDSEPDGYVTCTVKQRQTNQVSSILCSYDGDAGGCKNK